MRKLTLLETTLLGGPRDITKLIKDNLNLLDHSNLIETNKAILLEHGIDADFVVNRNGYLCVYFYINSAWVHQKGTDKLGVKGINELFNWASAGIKVNLVKEINSINGNIENLSKSRDKLCAQLEKLNATPAV